MLIPINFFLHNRRGQLSVDELVIQAIKRDHSIVFDRLALFALHLNRVGGGRDKSSGKEIVSRPALWANKFVRQSLWSQGTWLTSALLDTSLDLFFSKWMSAKTDVRVKCRSNYRHILELCKYWPSSLPVINSGVEQWIAPALFLAWDRHILDGGSQEDATLLGLIDSEELYKLFGTTKKYVLAEADSLLHLYKNVGYLDRFKNRTNDVFPALRSVSSPSLAVRDGATLELLDQEASDGVVERYSVERKAQHRNRTLAAALKHYYENRCQFCGTRLPISANLYYSEAAHVKGVGEPHNGPDKPSNMLVLCPNHHLQFDRGVLRLKKVGSIYQIRSKKEGDSLHGKQIKLTHKLDQQYVKYHYDWFT